MEIIVTNSLSQEQESDARDLIPLVKERDGFIKEPYLFNKLNFDLEMPAFFLGL